MGSADVTSLDCIADCSCFLCRLRATREPQNLMSPSCCYNPIAFLAQISSHLNVPNLAMENVSALVVNTHAVLRMAKQGVQIILTLLQQGAGMKGSVTVN